MLWAWIRSLHFSPLISFSKLILRQVFLLMSEGLFVLTPPFLFLYMIAHIWLYITELHIAWGVVHLGVEMKRFLVPSAPWILLAICTPNLVLWHQLLCLYIVLARTSFVCRTTCIFQCYFFFLHMLACVGTPMRPSPIGSLVSRGDPVSIVVFIFISCEFLAHKSNPSTQIGFLLCWGCQLFFASGRHVLPQYRLRPNLGVQSFLAFSCHPYYLSFTFLIFVLLFFLPCSPNSSGPCIYFYFYLLSKVSMCSS